MLHFSSQNWSILVFLQLPSFRDILGYGGFIDVIPEYPGVCPPGSLTKPTTEVFIKNRVVFGWICFACLVVLWGYFKECFLITILGNSLLNDGDWRLPYSHKGAFVRQLQFLHNLPWTIDSWNFKIVNDHGQMNLIFFCLRWFFTFYHGKSPFFTTIWGISCIFFQPPNGRKSKEIVEWSWICHPSITDFSDVHPVIGWCSSVGAYGPHTVDGNQKSVPAPVEVGSWNLPLFIGFFLHARWLFGISEPSTVSKCGEFREGNQRNQKMAPACEPLSFTSRDLDWSMTPNKLPPRSLHFQQCECFFQHVLRDSLKTKKTSSTFPLFLDPWKNPHISFLWIISNWASEFSKPQGPGPSAARASKILAFVPWELIPGHVA